MAYAQNTSVPIEKTMGELRRLAAKHKSQTFSLIEHETQAGVMMRIQDRAVRIVVPLPTCADVMKDALGRYLKYSKARHDRLLRQRWRAILLLLTAKFEMIELGIETFDQAFMPYLVLKSGQTMAEAVMPQISSGVLMLADGKDS